MTQRRLTMIGNAHIDPVWLWDWRDGFRTTLSTYRAAVDLLDAYPETTFTTSSPQLHRWVEEADPALFERIRAYVAEGRWVICGAMWIEPDCNLPGAESFARHLLLAQRYMLSRFGRRIRTGYNVDSFGHTATLPKILRAGGIEHYCFSRPGIHEKQLPGELFRWQADDGSEVLAYRIPYSYGTLGALDAHIDRVRARLTDEQPDLMCFYGVGNHGGGPTRENIEEIRARIADPEDEVDYRFGDPERWFAEQQARGGDWPVLREDLQFHAIGCYSVHQGIKRDVYRAEAALLDAEALGVMARQIDPDFPLRDLSRGWEHLLFNQFHDTLPGTSIAPAYRDARDQLGAAISLADEAATYAMARIVAAIDTRCTQRGDVEPDAPVHVSGYSAIPLIVVNPTGQARAELVRCEIAPGEHVIEPGAWALEGPQGERIAVQLDPPAAYTHGRLTLVFPASLPPLGYARYRLLPVAGPAEPQPAEANDVAAIVYPLGDGHQLGIDRDLPARTGITRVVDGVRQTLLQLPPRLYALPDLSDTWSHDIDRYAEDVAAEAEAFELLELRPVQTGPYCERWCWTLEHGPSRAWIYVDFDRVHGRLDWQLVVNWQAPRALLKLAFDCPAEAPELLVGVPFGARRTPGDGREFPLGRWCALTAGPQGQRSSILLANRSLGGASFDGRELQLTLLRSPAFAHHDPYVIETPLDDAAYIDIGVHRFELAMRVAAGPASVAEADFLAAALAQPLRAELATVHDGGLQEASRGWLRVTPETVQVTAVKLAEDGAGTVIRCYEAEGRETAVELALGAGTPQRLLLRPHELATLLVAPDGGMTRVDLVEEPLVDTEGGTGALP